MPSFFHQLQCKVWWCKKWWRYSHYDVVRVPIARDACDVCFVWGALQALYGVWWAAICFWKGEARRWQLKNLFYTIFLQLCSVYFGKVRSRAHAWACKLLHEDPDDKRNLPHRMVPQPGNVCTGGSQEGLGSVHMNHWSLSSSACGCKLARSPGSI